MTCPCPHLVQTALFPYWIWCLRRLNPSRTLWLADLVSRRDWVPRPSARLLSITGVPWIGESGVIIYSQHTSWDCPNWLKSSIRLLVWYIQKILMNFRFSLTKRSRKLLNRRKRRYIFGTDCGTFVELHDLMQNESRNKTLFSRHFEWQLLSINRWRANKSPFAE